MQANKIICYLIVFSIFLYPISSFTTNFPIYEQVYTEFFVSGNPEHKEPLMAYGDIKAPRDSIHMGSFIRRGEASHAFVKSEGKTPNDLPPSIESLFDAHKIGVHPSLLENSLPPKPIMGNLISFGICAIVVTTLLILLTRNKHVAANLSNECYMNISEDRTHLPVSDMGKPLAK